MSYDVIYGPNERNITFNISRMLGLTPIINLRDLSGLQGRDAQPIICEAIKFLDKYGNRAELEKLEPSNGWGSRLSLIGDLGVILTWIAADPLYTFKVM